MRVPEDVRSFWRFRNLLSFPARVAPSSRAPSLQRLSPPSSVLWTRPTPRPAGWPWLAALYRPLPASAPSEVSRVQRVSFAACRPCYPGGVCGRVEPSFTATSCLRQLTRGSASPSLYEATPRFTRVTARCFAAVRLRHTAFRRRFCRVPHGTTQDTGLRDCSTLHHGGLLSSR